MYISTKKNQFDRAAVLKRLIFWRREGGGGKNGGKKSIDSQTINVVRAKPATEAINRWSNVHSLSSDGVTLGECAWKSSKPWWIAIKVSRCLGTVLSSTPSSFRNALVSTCYVYNRVRAEFIFRWFVSKAATTIRSIKSPDDGGKKQRCLRIRTEKQKKKFLIKHLIFSF